MECSPYGYQLFNLTDFVNIAFCSRKAYVGEGLVPSRTGFTGDHPSTSLRVETRVALTFPLTTLCGVVMIIS
jgi:hypothetical protein